MKQIAYIEADKYVLAREYSGLAPFKPEADIATSYGSFSTTGGYTVNPGFLFSANWPAINTVDSRRAAMVHDFFYCLMKDGHLPRGHRAGVDHLFYTMLLEDKMIPIRAFAWYKAVRLGGEAALNSPKPEIYLAPRDPATIPDINAHKPLR